MKNRDLTTHIAELINDAYDLLKKLNKEDEGYSEAYDEYYDTLGILFNSLKVLFNEEE